jgi:hypothetical protein
MFRKVLFMGLFVLLLFINGCGNTYLFKSNYKLVKIENSNLCKMNILNEDIENYIYEYFTSDYHNNHLKIDLYKENNKYVVVFTSYKKSYYYATWFAEGREYYNYESFNIGKKINQVINNNEFLGFYEKFYKKYNHKIYSQTAQNNYDYVTFYSIHYKINYKANSLYKGIEIVDNTNLQDYFTNRIITMFKEVQPYQYIGANNELKTIKSYEVIILYLPSDEVEECINGEPYKLAK